MTIRLPLVVVSGQVQQLQSADAMLHVGAYAPGSFAIVDGQFVIMTERLVLTTNQRVTLAGTSRLRIT